MNRNEFLSYQMNTFIILWKTMILYLTTLKSGDEYGSMMQAKDVMTKGKDSSENLNISRAIRSRVLLHAAVLRALVQLRRPVGSSRRPALCYKIHSYCISFPTREKRRYNEPDSRCILSANTSIQLNKSTLINYSYSDSHKHGKNKRKKLYEQKK